MTNESRPPKLPPGFPLPSVDKAGRSIQVGAKVRILSVSSCARGLPSEDRARLLSHVGQVFEVREIDRYGMIWFGLEGGSSSFSLRPEEISVE